MSFAGSVVVLIHEAAAATERVGNPISWEEQWCEAFKNDDAAGQEQSRATWLPPARGATHSGRWPGRTSPRTRSWGSVPYGDNYEAKYYLLREKDVGDVHQPPLLPLEVL